MILQYSGFLLPSFTEKELLRVQSNDKRKFNFNTCLVYTTFNAMKKTTESVLKKPGNFCPSLANDGLFENSKNLETIGEKWIGSVDRQTL